MQEHLICSSSLGNLRIPVGVLSPPSPAKRVIIFLHGYNGSSAELYSKLSLQAVADRYQALIVCPNLGNGYYIHQNIGEFLAIELIAYLQHQYDFPPERDVILAGVSMGGFGAILVAAHFPQVFTHVIAISPTLICHDVAIGNPEVTGTSPQVLAYFRNTFGPDFADLEDDPQRNPIAALGLLRAEKHTPSFYLSCGRGDMLHSRNIAALAEFEKNGIPCEWTELPGAHTYDCFYQGLLIALDRITSSIISPNF